MPVTIKVTAETAEEELKARALEARHEALDEVRDQLINDIIEFTPVRFGGLLASIEELARTEDTVWVGTKKWYAHFVEFGTKAHEITARNGKELYWAGDSHPEKEVKVSGSPEQAFMRHGKERASVTVGDIAGRIIADAMGARQT